MHCNYIIKCNKEREKQREINDITTANISAISTFVFSPQHSMKI